MGPVLLKAIQVWFSKSDSKKKHNPLMKKRIFPIIMEKWRGKSHDYAVNLAKRVQDLDDGARPVSHNRLKRDFSHVYIRVFVQFSSDHCQS